jgi:hypothetical protein
MRALVASSSSTITCRPPSENRDVQHARQTLPARAWFRAARELQVQQEMRVEPVLQFGRRAEGDHLAAIHQRDAVAVFGLVHVVGADENGVAGAERSWIRSQNAPRAMGSTPEVGSSRKRIGGSCRMAQPSASRCFQPPESVRVSVVTAS